MVGVVFVVLSYVVLSVGYLSAVLVLTLDWCKGGLGLDGEEKDNVDRRCSLGISD